MPPPPLPPPPLLRLPVDEELLLELAPPPPLVLISLSDLLPRGAERAEPKLGCENRSEFDDAAPSETQSRSHSNVSHSNGNGLHWRKAAGSCFASEGRNRSASGRCYTTMAPITNKRNKETKQESLKANRLIATIPLGLLAFFFYFFFYVLLASKKYFLWGPITRHFQYNNVNLR